MDARHPRRGHWRWTSVCERCIRSRRRMAFQTYQDHRAVPAWRLIGHHRALHHPAVVGSVEANGAGREQVWRQRQSRRRFRCQVGTRRLHLAAMRCRRAGDQPVCLCQAGLRSVERPERRHDAGVFAALAGRASVGAGQQPERTRRAFEKVRSQLRGHRHGQRAASGGRRAGAPSAPAGNTYLTRAACRRFKTPSAARLRFS